MVVQKKPTSSVIITIVMYPEIIKGKPLFFSNLFLALRIISVIMCQTFFFGKSVAFHMLIH